MDTIQEPFRPKSASPQRRPLLGFILLVGALALTFAAVGPISYYTDGEIGLAAASLAAVGCLLGGLAALAGSWLWRGTDAALINLLVGMMFRTGVPLGLALAVFYSGRPLVDAGFARCLLVFYLVTLVVETLVSVAELRPAGRASGGA